MVRQDHDYDKAVAQLLADISYWQLCGATSIQKFLSAPLGSNPTMLETFVWG